MCKKLAHLVFFVLMVSQACNAVEVARWDFEETSGTTATDGTGLYVATLSGSDSLNVAGKFGSGIDFAGDGGSTVDAASSEAFRFTGDFSIALWVNSDVAWGDYTRFVDISAADGGLQDSYRLFTQSGANADNFRFMSRQDGSNTQNIHTRDMAVGIWILLVVRHDLDGDVTMNVLQDGDSVDEAFVAANSESWPTAGPIVYAEAELKLGRMNGTGRKFDGKMDALAFYDEVLTDAQVAMIFNTGSISGPSAADPSPADGATDVPRDVVLSWTPGKFAPPINGHKVYFGENFNDVNDGIGGIAQDATSYTPAQRLDLGTTYYWRVDEVNDVNPDSPWIGNVWSFTTEPVAYAVENIAVTASSQAPNRGVENTVNGSGLDETGLLHGKDGDDNMWLSDTAGPQPTWIEFQFDKIYKLHEMWVWNYNEFMEPLLGLGFKDVSIEYSVNGTDYTALGTTAEFAQGPGTAEYAHNTTVDFGGLTAKYVRLTANSNWGGMLPQYGLSEVRFLYIPVRAREPSPDSGTADVDVDVTLSWRAGRETAQHDVYLSTDEQAVIDGTAPVTTVPGTSYGPLSLDLAQTYYWKVNEVNTAETPTTLEGDVWNFTTREFLVVDDFESYNDLDPDDPESNRIFNAWIDGFEQPTNGSIVGYAAAPFAEQSIVHSGGQSMPLFYDNTGTARYSEAELTLSPAQDWTKHGVNALSLWFSGDPNNVPDKMYVKVNGSKVTYDGAADNLTLRPWQPWNIDLASFGIDVQNVTKFSIGFGDEASLTPGGSGVVYFDDIRLYPYSPELVTPAEPAPGNLVAHYEFEGTANDSSGNGLHGTAMGEPAFVAGKFGQAISLDGFNDFVEITGYKGILGPNAVTVTAWINTTSTVTGTIVGWGPNIDGQRFGFRVNENRIRMENAGGNVQGDSNITDGQWHHVAVTIQENATISYPDVTLYVDGIDDTRAGTDPDAFNLTASQDVRIGSRPASNDRFFMGLIDDVRIYDRTLTPEEVAWLAGRTQPFDKPF